MILGAVGLFYVVMWITNTSIAELNAHGWLLEPQEQTLSHSFAFSDLTDVNWLVILGQTGKVATILVISVVALLLNASGLELVVRKDILFDFTGRISSLPLQVDHDQWHVRWRPWSYA